MPVKFKRTLFSIITILVHDQSKLIKKKKQKKTYRSDFSGT